MESWDCTLERLHEMGLMRLALIECEMVQDLRRFQADWAHGDWHHWVDDRGQGTGDKSDEWKDPYHQGRALLECLELLRET